VSEALSGIDVELTRRASLIPSLVHTVSTFASHEKGILDHVTDARAALTSATGGKSVAQRSAAERELDTALGQVLALGQSTPAQLVRQLPQPSGQPRRHREQACLRQAVLQRRGGHPEPDRQHDSLDVRRAAGGVSEREYYQIPK
jgi:LemA protein